MNENSLSKSLGLTIARIGDFELPAEILEFTIDQALDSGVLKDIPVVGWIAKGLSVGESISDRIFYNKILRFINDLENINEGSKETFRAKMNSDNKLREKVGENLILLLNKIDSLEKTKLLAICFDHFITGHIDYPYFVDLSSVIERATLSDLNALLTQKSQYRKFNSPGVAVSSGILEYGLTSPISITSELPELGTRLSSYGTDLKDIFLGTYRERVEQNRETQNLLFGENS